ncbi:MAG: hypothetical protein NVSMB17_17150 [Candidatus Dormibacteria bacterium]
MSAVTDDWPHLIGDVSDIAARCVLAEEHISSVDGGVSYTAGGPVLLHGHCHQEALWGTGQTRAALERVPGVTVETVDSGCCGMAGSFGYQGKQDDLSRAMANRVLVPAVNSVDADVAIVATGTSCRHQLADLAARGAVHPLVYLADHLEQARGQGGETRA